MSIVSRYIVSSYLRIIGLCAGSFISIYLVIDFLEKIARFTRAQGKPLYILLFFLCKIPEIASEVTPLAVLMATLLTLGMLSRHSEIIAMRGCGISTVRITAPILVTAFAISLITFFLAELVIPASFARMRYIQQVLIEKKSPNTFFRQQNIWFRQENMLLQARIFNPDDQTLKGITVWRISSGMKPVQRIEANTGIFTDKGWILKDVVIRDISGGNVATTIKEKELPMQLSLRIADLKVLEKEAGTMSIFALRRYCEKIRKEGYDDTRYLAQLHSRISFPFASLVMAFLGIPFALRGGRTSGIAVGIAVSLGIGFGYFAVNAVLLSFGQAGVLPPLIAAWAANFIFAATAVWLAMTVNR
jgi:lipopolysaccharide export system permease protein